MSEEEHQQLAAPQPQEMEELQAENAALRQRVMELEQQVEQLVPYQSFFEQIPISLMIYDLQGLNIASNRQSEILFNTPRAAIECQFNIFADPESQEKGFVDQCRRALDGDTASLPPTPYDVVRAGFHGQPDNPIVWIETTYIPLRDTAGTIRCIGEINLDVTCRMHTEEVRNQAESALQQAYAEMEQRVAQRTAELNEINIKLQEEVYRSEQALRNLHTSEEQYRAIFEKNAAIKLLVDPADVKIVEANSAAAAFYGYTIEELQGMPIANINSSPIAEIQHAIQHILAGERQIFHFPHRLASGEVRDVEVFASPIAMQERTIIYSIVHDITERKQAETALRNSEAQFRAFFEQAPLGIGVSREGVALMVNPAYRRMFGYTQDDVLQGTSILENVAPDERAALMERAQQRYRGELGETRHEMMCLRKDGSMFPAFYDVARIVLSDGEPASVAFFSDITHIKETEAALQQAHNALEQRVEERTMELEHAVMRLQEEVQERRRLMDVLREQEEMLRAVLDASPDIISRVSAEGEILWSSQAKHEVLGIACSSGSQEQWIHCIHPEDQKATLELFRHIFLHPDEPHQRRFRVQHANGSWIVLESHARLLKDQQGQPDSLVSVSRDVTKQVEMEHNLQQARQQAEAAARSKDEFLANMSHELRTPLNAMLGITESLQDYVYGPMPHRQLEMLAKIEQSGHHLLALINDVLDLARIESGQLDVQSSAVHIESLCQQSLQSIKQNAAKKDIAVSLERDERITELTTDEKRLNQILDNLLANAVKFTPRGGRIGLQVKADTTRGRIDFIVWDSGIGIPDHEVPRMFEPFVQLDSGLARKYEGTGLGLSLVARLTDLLGGTISVESVVGKGSQFTVSFPVEVSDVSAPQHADIPAEPTVTPTPPPQPLVLLAEDNPTTAELLVDYLSMKGYRVVLAEEGQQVLDRIREERPAIILMDVHMPGMDGLEAIRHIRADTALADIPIIALTAMAMQEDRDICLEAGANEYLSKPVRLKYLLQVIKEFAQT
jgi:PAS domain S-box-containing protein